MPGASKASVARNKKNEKSISHSLIDSKRTKNNFSEMRVKTSHFEINIESLKSNVIDSAHISKLDETT